MEQRAWKETVPTPIGWAYKVMVQNHTTMDANDHNLSYLPKIYNLLKARGTEPHICAQCQAPLQPVQQPAPPPPAPAEKVYHRDEVIDRLKISETTYYRHIQRGILVPRQSPFSTKKYYHEEDLEAALEYSRIHGYL